MRLSTLRYFINVAQYGSYTRASEHLYISQPTLSRQIQELEQELGVQLFIRDKKSLILTEAGKLLMKEAEVIVERCDCLPELFRKAGIQSCKTVKSVKIGYQDYFNMQEIYPIANQILLENPSYDFFFQQGSITELKQGIEMNRFDVVFALGVYFEQMPQIKVISFQSNRLQLVVPQNHFLAEKKCVTFSELEEEKFLLINRQNSPVVADYVISQCIKNGFSPNAAHYINNLTEGLELAAMGKGITFLHSSMDTNGLEQKYNVKVLDVLEEEVFFDFCIIYNEDNQNSTLQVFLNYMIRFAESLKKV